MTRRTTAALACLALAAGLTACSSDEPSGPERISITPVKDGATSGLNPLGDGTRATVAGYTMVAVRLPGATALLTGFAVGTRGFVHVHPLGAPEVTDDGTVLTFHTTFEQPGSYRMFVQVRVDGMLHQVAVTATVNSHA